MLDQENSVYLIPLSILITVWWKIYGCYWEKLHVDYLWGLKGKLVEKKSNNPISPLPQQTTSVNSAQGKAQNIWFDNVMLLLSIYCLAWRDVKFMILF